MRGIKEPADNEFILFVGDTDTQLATIALDHNKDACLLSLSNFDNIQKGTYFTSIADLGPKNFFKGLCKANKIIYCPPEKWTSERMKELTEEYLSEFSHSKTVINFNRPKLPKKQSDMLNLKDTRKTTSKQIWIAGCSISDGTGVTECQRYGHLIQNELQLPVSFLTYPGSSIQWAADQILRSNIVKDDIIFWGVTSLGRTQCWDEQENILKHLTVGSFKSKKFAHDFLKIKYLSSDTNLYHALIAVHQVSNYCKAIEAKLILGILLPGLETIITLIPNCIDFISRFDWIDYGSDGEHPGVETHKLYAELFLEKYKSLL